jgi:hypothetical protein
VGLADSLQPAEVCPPLREQALVGQPDFRGPKLAWHVEDAALHRGGAAIAGPHQYLCHRCWKPQVSRLSGELNYEMAFLELSRWKSRVRCRIAGRASEKERLRDAVWCLLDRHSTGTYRACRWIPIGARSCYYHEHWSCPRKPGARPTLTSCNSVRAMLGCASGPLVMTCGPQ